jgi:hypothetical protein
MSFCCEHGGEERTPNGHLMDIECLQEDIAFLRLSCESVRYRCQVRKNLKYIYGARPIEKNLLSTFWH